MTDDIGNASTEVCYQLKSERWSSSRQEIQSLNNCWLTSASIKNASGCFVKERLKPVQHHGYPKTLRIDNGPEFISKNLDLWAYAHKMTLDFSRPGKPTDNALIESFNGSFRDECLNTHWFLSIDDAKKKIDNWRRDYNEFRPHSSLGNLTPKQFWEKHIRSPKSLQLVCPEYGWGSFLLINV